MAISQVSIAKLAGSDPAAVTPHLSGALTTTPTPAAWFRSEKRYLLALIVMIFAKNASGLGAGTGLVSQGSASTVIIGRSTITGNTTGVASVGGGVLQSF